MKALRDVFDPVKMFRRNLEPGHVLNGAGVISLTTSPYTYQNIARNALMDLGEGLKEEEEGTK